MPAPTPMQRITWGFSGGAYGWTENFYTGAPNLQAAFALVTQTKINQRLAILARGFQLNFIKATDVSIYAPGTSPVLRQTLYWPQTNGIGKGDYGDLGGGTFLNSESGEYFQSLLLRMEAGQTNRRSFLLRGIPDEITDNAGNYTPTPAWITAFNAWRADFSKGNSQWGLRALTAGPQIGIAAVVIANGGNSVTLQISQGLDPMWLPGQIVRISSVQGAAFLTGYWKVFTSLGLLAGVTPPAVGYYLRQKKRPVLGTVTNLPRVQAINPAFLQFTAIYPERGAKKSTGRPIGLSRGRARVRQN